MKKVVVLVIFVTIFAAFDFLRAEEIGSSQGFSYCPYCGSYMGPQGGYGMGPGVMRQGMVGRGMMGGQGMGLGMMGHGMTGRGFYAQSPECQKFFDETVGLRRELHNKRFEFFEAARNPKTTGEALAKIEKEVRELEEKIFAKGPIGCWQ